MRTKHILRQRGEDGVVAAAGCLNHPIAGRVDEKQIIAAAASHRIGAGAAIQSIVARAAIQRVTAAPAAQPVGVVVADQNIIAVTAVGVLDKAADRERDRLSVYRGNQAWPQIKQCVAGDRSSIDRVGSAQVGEHQSGRVGGGQRAEFFRIDIGVVAGWIAIDAQLPTKQRAGNAGNRVGHDQRPVAAGLLAPVARCGKGEMKICLTRAGVVHQQALRAVR